MAKDWVQKQMDRIHQGETGQKYSPTQPREPAGGPGGGRWTSGSGGGATTPAPGYAGPVSFSKPKITRSAYGATRGEQLKRVIEVQRQSTGFGGLPATILYIQQMGKDTPFRLFGLRGNRVGNEHNSLHSAKREATQIAEKIETEDQLP